MAERKKARFSIPAVGGSSLLVVFAVLCLTVFALLGLSTVRADSRLADASADAVQGYYAADCAAQEILARLRRGEVPEGVDLYDSGALYADYTCPISDTQELQVEICFPEGVGGGYEILRWQAVTSGEWDFDDRLDLWDGELPE